MAREGLGVCDGSSVEVGSSVVVCEFVRRKMEY